MIPLPRYRADEIANLNRIFRNRRPTAVRMGQRELRIQANPQARPAQRGMVIEIEADGRLFRLDVPRAIVEPLVAQMFADVPLADLDPGFQALLIEAAMAPLVEAFERASGRRLAFRRIVGDAPAPELRTIGLDLWLEDATVPQKARIFVDAIGLDVLARLVELVPLDPIEAGTLPIELTARVGRARITWAESARLGIGDLVVVDATSIGARILDLVLGNVLAFRAKIDDHDITLTGEVRKLMADESAGASAQQIEEAADLESLPVTLVFEIGRLSVPLGELRTLTAGFSFDLGRDLRSPVDILVSGKKIGTGELIQIDERIGVRIARLFDHG